MHNNNGWVGGSTLMILNLSEAKRWGGSEFTGGSGSMVLKWYVQHVDRTL